MRYAAAGNFLLLEHVMTSRAVTRPVAASLRDARTRPTRPRLHDSHMEWISPGAFPCLQDAFQAELSRPQSADRPHQATRRDRVERA